MAWILVFESHYIWNKFSFLKKHFESWQMRRIQMFHCMEMAAITCFQSTWSHLVGWKALVTSRVCFRISLRSCWVVVDFFHENEFLYKDRNDVKISQTWEFLVYVYFCRFVCNFAVKLAFVMSVLAIVFTIKVWCQFHPHSSYQSFNQNCTTSTTGLSCIGR